MWEYDDATTQGRKGNNLLALHPTAKPVQLVMDALLDCSNRGDLVLDFFLGSGTTLLAAERTGRICRGIELDPLYVDTAIRRWQNLTGRDAARASTGSSSVNSRRRRSWAMSGEEKKDYEVGYGKPPIARGSKKACVEPGGKAEKASPGARPWKDPPRDRQRSNDDCGRWQTQSMRNAEINFRQLFGKAIKGDLTAARIIAKMAAKYFGPEAEGPGKRGSSIGAKAKSNEKNRAEINAHE